MTVLGPRISRHFPALPGTIISSSNPDIGAGPGVRGQSLEGWSACCRAAKSVHNPKSVFFNVCVHFFAAIIVSFEVDGGDFMARARGAVLLFPGAARGTARSGGTGPVGVADGAEQLFVYGEQLQQKLWTVVP